MKEIRSFLGIIKKPVIRDTFNITGWSLLGKGLGFVIPFLIARWFGVTSETDAFYFSYNVVLYFATVFAPSAESLMVPFVSEKIIKNEKLDNFLGEIAGIALIILFILTGMLAIIIKPLLSFVTNFSGKNLDLVYLLFLETFLLMVFLVFSAIFSGVLNGAKKFILPAVSPAIRAFVIIIFILILKDRIGVHSIALGYFMGELVRLLLLIFYLQQQRLFRFRIFFRFSQETKFFLQTIAYQSGGMIILGLLPLINQTMVSWLGEGAVSLFAFSERLYMLPVTFVASGMMIAFLAHWSQTFCREGRKALQKRVKKTALVILFLSVIMASVMFVFHDLIVNLVYGRSKISSDDLSIIKKTFSVYLFAFIFYTMSQIFSRALIILKKTGILMLTALIMVLINIFSNMIFLKPLGVPAVALSTFFIYLFSTSFIFFYLFRREVADDRL